VKKDTVVTIQQPTTTKDALTEVRREGAQKLLAEAVQAEVGSFLEQYQELRDEQGHQRVVRNGYLPEREIQTGPGGIKVRAPRTRDRDPGKEPEKLIRFRSSLVPPYLWRGTNIGELLPLLCLKGISTGNFKEALSALLGPDAPGLSADPESSPYRRQQPPRRKIGKSYAPSMIFWRSTGCTYSRRIPSNRPSPR